MTRRATEVTTAYTRRAQEYADVLGTMDAVHPSDRALIETWADGIEGRVLDAGCGPGHWTAHLASRGLEIRGLEIRGIDLVPSFIAHARATHPGMRFDVGSIEQIDEPDASLGGILSWYSTIHHEPSRISLPLDEFARVLRAGGTLVLGYFDAPSTESFDHAVIGAYRWSAQELTDAVTEAGFDVVEAHRRSGPGHRPHGALVCERRAS